MNLPCIVSEFTTVKSDHFPYECEPQMLKYVRRFQSPDGKRTWYYWPKRIADSPEQTVSQWLAATNSGMVGSTTVGEGYGTFYGLTGVDPKTTVGEHWTVFS